MNLAEHSHRCLLHLAISGTPLPSVPLLSKLITAFCSTFCVPLTLICIGFNSKCTTHFASKGPTVGSRSVGCAAQSFKTGHGMSLATGNAFAALSTKSAKKKSDKSKDGDGEQPGRKASKKQQRQLEEEQKAAMEAAIFGGGGPSVSNWADELDDEEDFELSRGGGLAPLPDDWAAEVRWDITADCQQASRCCEVELGPICSLDNTSSRPQMHAKQC